VEVKGGEGKDEQRHKHTTFVVSVHLPKYRQKIFNPVFTDFIIGVSLHHVALIFIFLIFFYYYYIEN